MSGDVTSTVSERGLRQILGRWSRSDIVYSFFRTPSAFVSGIIFLLILVLSIFAPLFVVQDPFNPAELDLLESLLPPSWSEEGSAKFLLGTDDQGRDMLAAILYGMRISLIVGLCAVAFAAILGIVIGLFSGFFGGPVSSFAMRLADVQLTVPGILIALMVDGFISVKLPPAMQDEFAIFVLIFAIGISDWPQYARIVRGAVLVQREKEYVQAARLLGLSRIKIMFRHVLPNVLSPVLVVATLGLALAVIAEATLSFLGVGMPPTTPSLGTLIRVGNDYLFSGEWWITFFPVAALVLLVLSVNLLGDWLRDVLNPRLR